MCPRLRIPGNIRRWLRRRSDWQIELSDGDAMTTVRADRIMKNNLALVAVVLPLVATVACNRSNVQAAAPGMPAPVVTVATATAQDVPKYLDEIGRNAAFESVTVTPQV